MTRNKWIVATVLTLACLSGAGIVLAQQEGAGDKTDKQLVAFMNEHKMPLARAIEAAEQHCKGHAVRATAHMHGSDATVNVNVVVGETTHQIAVDVKTGKVTEDEGHGAGKHDATKPHAPEKKKP